MRDKVSVMLISAFLSIAIGFLYNIVEAQKFFFLQDEFFEEWYLRAGYYWYGTGEFYYIDK